MPLLLADVAFSFNELPCVLWGRQSRPLSTRWQLQLFLLFFVKPAIVFELALVTEPASVFPVVVEVAMDLGQFVVAAS